jgi:hypothetical protein
LADLAEDWTRSDEGPETWSPYQVVAHLTHIEEVDWIDRVGVILDHGTGRVFEPVDREAGFSRFAGGLKELLDRFETQRTCSLETLDALVTAEDLKRQGTHPTFGDVTLSELLATWTVHDLNHLGHMVKTMAKQYTQPVGPWREFLPIIDAP